MSTSSSNTQAPDATWKEVYKVGGVSSIIAVLFGMIQIIINIISLVIMHVQVPTTVIDWFTLLQTHRLIGLNDLTLFQIPFLVFCVPMFLALYAALYQINKVYLTITMILAFLGLAVYLSSNMVFSMLSLSNQYATATTDTQRSMLLASGQAMFAIYEGSGVDVGLSLLMIAILMTSVIMLQSHIFKPVIAYMGLLTSLFALAYYISIAFTPKAIFIFEVSGLFFLVWVILVGRRLLQLVEKTHQWH